MKVDRIKDAIGAGTAQTFAFERSDSFEGVCYRVRCSGNWLVCLVRPTAFEWAADLGESVGFGGVAGEKSFPFGIAEWGG